MCAENSPTCKMSLISEMKSPSQPEQLTPPFPEAWLLCPLRPLPSSDRSRWAPEVRQSLSCAQNTVAGLESVTPFITKTNNLNSVLYKASRTPPAQRAASVLCHQQEGTGVWAQSLWRPQRACQTAGAPRPCQGSPSPEVAERGAVQEQRGTPGDRQAEVAWPASAQAMADPCLGHSMSPQQEHVFQEAGDVQVSNDGAEEEVPEQTGRNGLEGGGREKDSGQAALAC